MTNRRKDSKGRILRPGERQRSDGTYEYRYIDAFGKRRSAYSQRLVESDTTKEAIPKPPLRELENQINQQIKDGIDIFSASHNTVNDLFDLFIKSKCGVKESTLQTYQTVYNVHIREYIGHLHVDQVKPSTISKFYKDNVKRLNSNTLVFQIDTIVKGMFDLALKDRVITFNPAYGMRKELGTVNKPKKQTYALTEEQQKTFLDYISGNTSHYNNYRNLIIVISFTGCRISEIIGLQRSSCEFENHRIKICDTLRIALVDHKSVWKRNTPKSLKGYRYVPMIPIVEEALKDQINYLETNHIKQPDIEGLNDFVFLTSRSNPIENSLVWTALKYLVQDCNEQEIAKAKAENRSPVIVPHISAHVFRRTFCTRFCEKEPNYKVIQTIMGHSNIATTMIYNDVSHVVMNEGMKAILKISNDLE